MDRASEIVTEESWANITAVIHTEYDKEFHGDAPILYITEFAPCEPLKDDLVYFR